VDADPARFLREFKTREQALALFGSGSLVIRVIANGQSHNDSFLIPSNAGVTMPKFRSSRNHSPLAPTLGRLLNKRRVTAERWAGLRQPVELSLRPIMGRLPTDRI
jgi:hypothetical protein